jgi:hypothetical protein
MSEQGHMQEELGQALQKDMRTLYRVPVSIEPAIDAAIAALARDRAAAALRRRSVARLARWGLFAAAGLALGVSLTVYLARPTPATRVALAEDLNHDGVVDILDALILERAVEGKGPGLVDLNGDGSVDQRDVDRVAMAAVSLGKGG